MGSFLRLMLNLHPQGGTDACQKNWTAFAAAIDYAGAAIVPCTWGNQRIAAAAFDTFMDGEDLAAVDGWCESALVIPYPLALFCRILLLCSAGPDFDYEGDCFDAPTAGVANSSWPGIAWSNEVFAGKCVVGFARVQQVFTFHVDFSLAQDTKRRRATVGRSSSRVVAALVPIATPCPFSGDANQHQEILRWELHSTPTAANVLTSWSNDVVREA